MRKFLFTAALCASLALGAQQSYSVLFIGNSYTAVNNLPQLVHDLALANGDTVIFDSYTPGGYTFQMHSADATTRSKINSRPWDYVVLQGQSQEPSFDSAYVVQNVFPYARMLDSLIHVNDSCTQTVFYMTWGRKNGDASNCAAYPPVCTYTGMQGELRRRYLQMAHDNGAIVAPAGLAWREVRNTNPAFDLYMADESHPSLHGSYLTACVFYSSIFRESPIGVPFYSTLPQNEAQLLQYHGSHIVFDSLDLWNTKVYYPQPAWTATANGLSVTMNSTSVNANSVFWDFGNGNTGSANSYTHTFPANGAYPFTMIAYNDCLTDTLRDTLFLPLTTGINATTKTDFAIIPNPSSGSFRIRGMNGEKFSWIITDATGRIVTSGKADDDGLIECTLPAGSYSIELLRGDERTVKPLIILR